MTLVKARNLDGQVLVLVKNPKPANSGQTQPFESEVEYNSIDAMIPAGDISLEVRLYIPKSRMNRMAAVVLVHGSAPTDVNQQSYYIQTCLDAGLGVLSYSKRGCGNSGGIYRPLTVENSKKVIDELSNDASYALNWLKARPEIDSNRVGFVGGSQAGWIMPLAAMKSKSSFIVICAGAAVSVGMENFHSVLTGDGNEQFRKSETAKADSMLMSFDGPHGFDPRPILQEIDVDVLWFFGGRDDVIPVQASLIALEEIARNGNLRHTIRFIEGLDHNLYDHNSGKDLNLAVLIGEWLKERSIIE